MPQRANEAIGLVDGAPKILIGAYVHVRTQGPTEDLIGMGVICQLWPLCWSQQSPSTCSCTSTLIVRMLVWLLVVVVWRDECVIMEQWAN